MSFGNPIVPNISTKAGMSRETQTEYIAIFEVKNGNLKNGMDWN